MNAHTLPYRIETAGSEPIKNQHTVKKIIDSGISYGYNVELNDFVLFGYSENDHFTGYYHLRKEGRSFKCIRINHAWLLDSNSETYPRELKDTASRKASKFDPKDFYDGPIDDLF